MPKAVSSDSPERFEGHIPPGALLNAFNTSDRINRYLIENLPLDAWKAKPVEGKGRTIAAIVAHMHNVRVMWLKATKYEEIPPQLDRSTVTPAQALRGLEGSCQALSVVLARAIAGDGQIRNFAPMWPDFSAIS
jgi:uncharacterized damage-inducible protein DinB